MSAENSASALSQRRKRGRPPRDTSGILEAAVRVFAREGYGAATIEMIATEASASTATLYKRFVNKHGLFVAVLESTTAKSLAIHTGNRQSEEASFASIINRLEAHARVCSDPQVRGVMRAWIGEVRSQAELADLFAVRAGRELVEGLVKQLAKLAHEGLLHFESDDKVDMIFAAQSMLGIVERFTLMRGLVMGDTAEPIYGARAVSERAVHALVGMWGTPAGVAAFGQIAKTKLTEGMA